MIETDEDKYQALLDSYRARFVTREWWETEKFKWDAPRAFRRFWDLDAPDFPEMLERALAPAGSILGSAKHYPRLMLIEFAKRDPELVRQAFIELFDESQPVLGRIAKFTHSFGHLVTQVREESQLKAFNHYQSDNSCTVYLWLRYPEKYSIYKYSEALALGKAVGVDQLVSRGKFDQNFAAQQQLAREVAERLFEDRLIRAVLAVPVMRNHLADDASISAALVTANAWSAEHRDIQINLLAIDVSYFAHKVFSAESELATEPSETAESLAENDIAEQDIAAESDAQLSSALPIYSDQDFLSEVFLSQAQLLTLTNLLKDKKNLILQGAPGVGKTFAARRLAWTMMGAKNDSRIQLAQFHQSYAYEDFVLGYKPTDAGFALKEGIFYRFCTKAAADPGRDYFFIIDEINRGNISKIFGELLMGIEKSYRGEPLRLSYQPEVNFIVPRNLHIIGMMNTADRSLALIDYALRRRFSFFTMNPAFESAGFQEYLHRTGDDRFEKLIATVEKLNTSIAQDPALGVGFQIGHSYFCQYDAANPDWLGQVIQFEIVPLLDEYWFDDTDKAKYWAMQLLEAIK